MNLKAFYLSFLLLVLSLILKCRSSRVIELSDRFLDVRKDADWLIMFYSPNCAHCKRLDPVWSHVAQGLHYTNIRVGKIDCSRFTKIAYEFGIAGFPTIMFLKGDAKQFVFNGDRTKDEIINFAHRVQGPPVKQITRPESLEALRSSENIFFLYAGSPESSLFELFYSTAERFQPHSFFYSTSLEIAENLFEARSNPVILVHKEKTPYIFNDWSENEDLNETLSNWVNHERFATFVKVTRGNFHQLMQIDKFLVIAVIHENKLEEIPPEMVEFRDMVESIIHNNRDRFHRRFQFGWTGSPDLANSIAMMELQLPHLIVVNASTNHHHIPQDEPQHLTPEAITLFLESIENQMAPAYGGDTFLVRLYRGYFEGRTAFREMWRGNPVLTAVLFGLPLGFLLLILYSVCCSDILDADEEEEEEENTHEKKE
ncbi:unnamed protein product [Bemisia tabaci]|uniref:Thioredoxin domain-containing protein n=1 Tax=Bemisia tabaci TaxID=7038 RepID=A0A9P0G0I5_BEMTA|nr:PREDICTED: protein disulfide-isomerase TMX3-like isoform X2 [Bemisia tabaci]CAH0770454.1 unnamed protein product [Bemisia tabaci]